MFLVIVFDMPIIMIDNTVTLHFVLATVIEECTSVLVLIISILMYVILACHLFM